MSRAKSINIGTSGWHYQHWKGPFYPQDLPNEDLLENYTKYFQTVEINNTFYQLPDSKTIALWRDSVPDNFTFSVKASRYITHMKKLNSPYDSIYTFIDRVSVLDRKLGPILFQLPPRWHVNPSRLEEFLNALPRDHRYAFELRDPTWFINRTEEILTQKGAAFCIYDFEKRQSPSSVTADFIYVRLHGPDGAYIGKYNDRALSSWAEVFSGWAEEGKEIFCYFDNDEKGYAVQNALKLQELLMEK